MATNIRYGIMGSSQTATRFASAIKAVAGSEVLAVAGRELSAAKKQADKLGIKQAYGSYEELCNDDNIDVIYIPSYNRAHYACAKFALNNNKHVLMEKPFTHHKVGAEELFQLAANKGLFLMEAQRAIFLPLLLRVKKLLAEKTIGEVKFIDIKNYHKVGTPNEWITDLAAGGGALNYGGSYPLEVVSYLLENSISEFAGLGANKIGEADSSCTLTFKSNNVLVNAFITTSFKGESEMIITGTEGKIIIPNYWEATTAVIENQKGTQQLVDQSNKSSLAYTIEHVATCLKEKKTTSPIVTPKLTISSLAIIETLYQKWYGDPLN